MAHERRFGQRSVEKYMGYLRMAGKKRTEIVGHNRCCTDARIEASAAFARRQHVPQCDSLMFQCARAQPIRGVVWCAGQTADDGPERVSRVRVVLPGMQGRSSRHAAEDQQARVTAANRRKTSNDGHLRARQSQPQCMRTAAGAFPSRRSAVQVIAAGPLARLRRLVTDICVLRTNCAFVGGASVCCAERTFAPHECARAIFSQAACQWSRSPCRAAGRGRRL